MGANGNIFNSTSAIGDTSVHEPVNIGIVDSIYEPGDEFRRYNEVGETRDPNNFNVDATSTHGYDVLRVLTTFAANAKYHFYLGAGPDDDFRESHLARAINAAVEDGVVDVINISSGVGHITDPRKSCSDRGPQCYLCEITREAVDSGIPVIAAAGNNDVMDSIACPSLDNGVISVGGTLAECTAEVDEGDPLMGPNLPTVKPVNSLWIYRDDRPDTPPLCSTRGCLPGENCSANRSFIDWPGNVERANDKPNCLAPCVTVNKDENSVPQFSFGTSYSAPFVTSQVANAINGLTESGHNPNPSQIRTAIEVSRSEIEGVERLFDGWDFHNQIFSMFDIGLERSDNTFDI